MTILDVQVTHSMPVKFPLINNVMAWVMKKRFHEIELFMKYPVEVQREWQMKLVRSARETEYGLQHGFEDIRNYEDYRNRVPIVSYEDLVPLIDRQRRGEQNILWPTEIKWFAKSSGTTAQRSKFLPVSQESLEECHLNTGKDMLSIYCSLNPDTQMFSGKSLMMAGSATSIDPSNNSYYGDLSAILVNNLPFWADFLSTPDNKTALIENFEEKLDKTVEITIKENVTSLTGVPSWMLVTCHKVLEATGKDNLLEVWPDLELFIHGGVAFTPYREQFKQLIPRDDMHYIETYNASEGFFAIKDQLDSDDMLLMLDYGIFYEFIPEGEWLSESPKAIGLDEVVRGQQYAVVISTNAGLWRYKIGDTIEFTSLYPFRIRITGRTKYFINAFGEELIQDNAEQALAIACEKTRAQVREYTGGPVYMKDGASGAHEWVMEFEREPEDLSFFIDAFDSALKVLNTDYEAKRHKNMALQPPVVHIARPGLFFDWMKRRGKLGGQNKVPRLANHRDYLGELIEMNQ